MTQQTSNLHIPALTETVNTSEQQMRCLIIGPAGSGKSWAAKTFPNPYYLDWDDNLSHEYFQDVQRFPAYRIEDHLLAARTNDVYKWQLAWMKEHAYKMLPEQTLIFDSIAGFADALRDKLEAATPKSPKTGEADGYWFWKRWSVYFRELFNTFKKCKCRIVIIMHENEVRDSETGRVLSIKPLLQGQEFSPRIPSFFTNVFRQTARPNKIITTQDIKGAATIDYYWQVKSDTRFDIARTTIKTSRVFIPATYKSFTNL